jgi:hypothetical protein
VLQRGGDNIVGAERFEYFVPYQPDIDAALQELRRREFEAGRYNPAVPFPVYPVGPRSPAPGAQHACIEEAIGAAGASGTRSILDLHYVAEQPEFFAVAPLQPQVLQQVFGTAQPSREMIEQNRSFLDDVERGQGVYIVVYKEDRPAEIFFAGYSFD